MYVCANKHHNNTILRFDIIHDIVSFDISFSYLQQYKEINSVR